MITTIACRRRLSAAETVCADASERLTPLRRRVLELVVGSHRPIGAYAILDQLKEGGRSAAPPTIYRALEFLMEQGLVHRIESLNAFIGCAHPGESHLVQFLICRSCGMTAELDDRRLSRSHRRSATDHGFNIQSRVVELSGVCASCQSARPRGRAHPCCHVRTFVTELAHVRGLGKNIRGRPILDGVALSVAEREIVTIIGPNGAGKSMLLRILLGLVAPDRGERWLRPGIKIGYMPQRLQVDETLPLTVRRFLELGRAASKDELRAALDEVGAPASPRFRRSRRSPAVSCSACCWRAHCCAIRRCWCSTSRCKASISRVRKSCSA